MSGISAIRQQRIGKLFSNTLNSCTHSICVHLYHGWGLTEPDALIQRSLSLDGLLDDSLSGAVETTLPTFDPVHQFNLLEFRIKPLEVSTHTQVHKTIKSRYFDGSQIWNCDCQIIDYTFQQGHRLLFWSKFSFLDPTVPETTTASHLRFKRHM